MDSIDAGGVIDNARVTLVFAPDGTLSGRASCNGHEGRYERTGARLRVQSRAIPRKVCVPALMLQEARLLNALAATDHVHITADGALVLMAGPREVVHARHD